MSSRSYLAPSTISKLDILDELKIKGKSISAAASFEETDGEILLQKDLKTTGHIYVSQVDNTPESVVTKKFVNDFLVSKSDLFNVQTSQIGILNGIENLSSAEVSQIANIDSTTIPGSAWVVVGKLNQDVSSTSNPTFFKVNVSNPPSENSDLGNKGYIDGTIASTKTELDGAISDLRTVVDTKSATGSSYTKAESDTKFSAYQPKNSNLGLIDQSLGTNADVYFNSLRTNKVTPTDSKDVATKRYVDDSLSTKSDISATNLKADKAEIYVRNQLYTKSETDSLLGTKTENSVYSAKMTSLDNAINVRVLQSAYDTKIAQVDSAIASRLPQSTFDAYQVTTDASIGTRALEANTYNKNQVDSKVGLKLDTSAFNSYISTASADINSRLPTATYDAFVTQSTANLASKTAQSEFNSFVSNTNSSLNGKQPLSANLTSINQNLGTGNSPAFSQVFVGAAPSTNNSLVNKTYADAITTNLTNYKNSNDTALALNSSNLDAYKNSNDLAVADRVTTAFFQTYDTQVSSNFSNLQGQVSQRVKQTDFDQFRQLNNQQIGTKQDANGYLTGINQGLTTNDSPSFVGVTVSAAPATGTSLANKTYIDGLHASLTAGTGLTRNADTFSVNADQSQITTVGPLSSLNVQGPSSFAQPLTLPIGDSLKFTRQNGGVGQMMLGSDPASNELFSIKHLGGNGIIQLTTAANGQVSFNTPNVNMLSTTDTTSPTTGALKLLGGMGVAKSLQVGGELFVSNGSAARLKLQSNSNAIYVGAVPGDGVGDFHVYDASGNSRILGWYRNNNTLGLGYTNGSTIVQVSGTADSTSATNGSLQVQGGAGIAKNLNVGGNATMTGTLTASNVSSGSVNATFSQSGVTWTNVTTSVCNYSKIGRNVIASYEFVWQNQSGNANGQFTFSLPFPSKNVTVMKNVMVGDSNSYASNSGGFTDYLVKFTALSNNAVLYSSMAANLPAGTGSGGISFTIYYYANS